MKQREVRKKVVIVGGGISGLSSAYFLQQLNKFDITLIEAGEKFGGKIATINEAGFIVEKGPDLFLNHKQETKRLLKKMGYGHNIIKPKQTRLYLLLKGKLRVVPEEFLLMKPFSWNAIFNSSLFSLYGKLRILLEPYFPTKKGKADESAASFFKRRFGKSYVDNIVDPIFASLHTSQASKVSMLSKFYHFRKMESQYGSIQKALKHKIDTESDKADKSTFLSLKGGMHKLAEYIVYKLGYVNKKNNILVNDIETLGQQYTLKLSNGEHLTTDYVIFATPAYITSSIVNRLNHKAAKKLQSIPFASMAIVTLAIKKENFNHKLDGIGFAVPNGEGLQMTSCTWSSSKWEYRAPKDFVLIRCYYGRYKEDQIVEKTDEELTKLATKELKKIIDWDGEVYKNWVFKLKNSMPQYLVGHQRRVKQIEKSIKETPNILLTGASYYGVGLSDCIKQGQRVAKLLGSLTISKP